MLPGIQCYINFTYYSVTWPRALQVNVWFQYPHPSTTAFLQNTPKTRWCLSWILKAHWRHKSKEGMISYGNNQYSTRLTVALLLILSSAWRSFSRNLDPLRSHPSANEAILFTSSMNVPLISSPCTWLISLWSGLVLDMWLTVTHFHPYKYAHTCMYMNRHVPGFRNASHSWSRYFLKTHR